MQNNNRRKRRGKGRKHGKGRQPNVVGKPIYLSPCVRKARAEMDPAEGNGLVLTTLRQRGLGDEKLQRDDGLTMHDSTYVPPEKGLTVGGDKFEYERPGRALSVDTLTLGAQQESMHLAGKQKRLKGDKGRQISDMHERQRRFAQELMQDPAYA